MSAIDYQIKKFPWDYQTLHLCDIIFAYNNTVGQVRNIMQVSETAKKNDNFGLPVFQTFQLLMLKTRKRSTCEASYTLLLSPNISGQNMTKEN